MLQRNAALQQADSDGSDDEVENDRMKINVQNNTDRCVVAAVTTTHICAFFLLLPLPPNLGVF